VVAPGDFRLKKLLAPLEQAGAKAPVFAKVAESVKAVVEANEKTAAEPLLELSTLVNAVRYTQGETGLAGTLEPIETIDLGVTASQTSARILKPLLEALSTTGSGRLEIIRDAQQRGEFKDLRLVQPALKAIDDSYPEIADYIAEKVLPVYGKAILPELRGRFDLKGKGGHARRLRLMHTLDPAGTRETVKQALDTGSKEVKVAAIECLGPDDLSFLLEQAKAKALDVRLAAYQALAKIDDQAAVDVLAAGLRGKDVQQVARAIHTLTSPKLIAVILGEIERETDALPAQKDKKKAGEIITRLLTLIHTLPDRDTSTDALLLKLFTSRDKLVKVKGDSFSGSDLVEAVVGKMSHASPAVQKVLAESHAELTDEQLTTAVDAAREVLSPAAVYDTFSPYLSSKAGDKKAKVSRDAVARALGAEDKRYYWYRFEKTDPLKQPFDPRWLDLAVKLKALHLVTVFARPGHAGALTFAKQEFDAALKKAKQPDDVSEQFVTLLRLDHPDVVDAFIALTSKRTKATYYSYFYNQIIPQLPKSAIPKLEALIPTLPDNDAEVFLNAIQRLRDKP